ncbi:sigma-70 region 4 domain-containing protein [Sphingopyxis indica]|uniref:sigma-70 region 4 domain-containing protein n=1 Tax=Sphingopyxis indica TaxID=436663 RepID=UPI0029392D16|nr:sigma-70 region 4 domain-containing protein [Sphingopyxis indica]WOF45084.1 sigma-70 region 4 domain-containing protein [Sphingopyxis indica]
MSDHDARALLVEALDFFNDHPSFSLRRDRRRTSYELAARIDAFLAPDKAVLPVVADARQRWEASHDVRIDPGEQAVAREDDGYWVRAWVRLSEVGLSPVAPDLAGQYAHAVAALPEITRKVLLAHQRDNEDFRTIAVRLGITTSEVEQHIADALLAIGQALNRP